MQKRQGWGLGEGGGCERERERGVKIVSEKKWHRINWSGKESTDIYCNPAA